VTGAVNSKQDNLAPREIKIQFLQISPSARLMSQPRLALQGPEGRVRLVAGIQLAGQRRTMRNL
jgi:hypothetical protein